MFAAYLLAFCRMVMGMVFAWSFVGKVRDVRAFEETIMRFQVLPVRWSRLAARLVLGGEAAVVGALLGGGGWLWPGFLLAALMLLGFSAALVSLLRRRIQTACRCFGASEKPVSRDEIVRNAGLILCALGGLTLSLAAPSPLGWLESGLMGAAALVFVLGWGQVGELVAVFRQEPAESFKGLRSR